jgi:hypothetical protein
MIRDGAMPLLRIAPSFRRINQRFFKKRLIDCQKPEG